ncbi:hypothetical protein QP162_19175 [Sphingomonas aurantiaca]|uniref:hypothetical protein n=1 Tax=Sphingomonas aurantiaca TaxID=185949 RepID=UPI002FE36670
MVRSVEQALVDYAMRPQAVANPVMQRTLATLRAALSASAEYEGAVREAFNAVLQQLLVFAAIGRTQRF